jgi:hypothetical protein
MFDVVVQNVNLVPTDTRVLKSIDMSFQNTRQSFLHNVWADVQILEFGIALALINHQLVLCYQISFFLVFGFPCLVFLLDVLDEFICSVQVGTWSADFTWFFDVGASISPANDTLKIKLSFNFQKPKDDFEKIYK